MNWQNAERLNWVCGRPGATINGWSDGWMCRLCGKDMESIEDMEVHSQRHVDAVGAEKLDACMALEAFDWHWRDAVRAIFGEQAADPKLSLEFWKQH